MAGAEGHGTTQTRLPVRKLGANVGISAKPAGYQGVELDYRARDWEYIRAHFQE
jgi:hypothetical protein